MNGLQIFAFFVLPFIVLAMGLGAAWWNDWDLKRRRRQHPPGE